jgi:predicted nucleotidyltransferase
MQAKSGASAPGLYVVPMSPTLPPTLRLSERKALYDFVGWLRSKFGQRVHVLQLFGSRARGEGNEDSDLDVLAVIDDLTSAERREVHEQTGDALTNYDIILGGLYTSTAHWLDMRE